MANKWLDLDGKKIGRIFLKDGGCFHGLVFEYSYCGDCEEHWAVQYENEKEVRRINCRNVDLIEWDE